MATHTYAPLFGRRIRVTQLSGAGSPVGLNHFVTDGFVSISLAAETEDGAEIIQRNANNDLCINEKLANTFKRLTASVRFCGVNPTLLSWMSNAKTYLDYAGDEAGFVLNEGLIQGQFALELFTGLAGSLSNANAGGYALLPYLSKGTLADLTFDGENAVDFTVENMLSVSGNQWGTGPYPVVMGVGSSEVQSIAITGTPTGGTFTLTYGGQTTAPIAYNATAAAIRTALELLPAIGSGGLQATAGGPLPTAVTVTFRAAQGNVAQITANGAGLTGGTTPAVTVTTTTAGVNGAASKLPTALESLTHFLLLDTAVAAPAATTAPVAVPA